MDFLRFIVFDILGVTPLLVGFIALIGLLIQRKPISGFCRRRRSGSHFPG